MAAVASGRWSVKWAKQVCAWHNHNIRNSCGRLWAAGILQVRTSSWLQSTRQMFVPRRSTAVNPFTAAAGRLGTRMRRGGPSRRWEDAIHDAQEYIDNERLTGSLQFSSRRRTVQRYDVKSIQSLSLEQFERLDSTDDPFE